MNCTSSKPPHILPSKHCLCRDATGRPTEFNLEGKLKQVKNIYFELVRLQPRVAAFGEFLSVCSVQAELGELGMRMTSFKKGKPVKSELD